MAMTVDIVVWLIVPHRRNAVSPTGDRGFHLHPITTESMRDSYLMTGIVRDASPAHIRR